MDIQEQLNKLLEELNVEAPETQRLEFGDLGEVEVRGKGFEKHLVIINRAVELMQEENGFSQDQVLRELMGAMMNLAFGLGIGPTNPLLEPYFGELLRTIAGITLAWKEAQD